MVNLSTTRLGLERFICGGENISLTLSTKAQCLKSASKDQMDSRGGFELRL